MSVNAIDALFRRLRDQGRTAFIPFVTAGDPDLATTARVVRELAGCGANLIEIGFPYSDPIADGPVIQASYTRALDRGLRLDDVFACARVIADAPEFAGGKVPLLAMTSYSLVHRRGPEAFLRQARAAGFSGAIVPDLPCEESEALGALAAGQDFKLVQLVTPATPRARAEEIARRSTGFLYCVSVTGITGERDQLPADLAANVRGLKQLTDRPVCVGFGISQPRHVKQLVGTADGAIVGSFIVRRMKSELRSPRETLVAAIRNEVAGLSESTG